MSIQISRKSEYALRAMTMLACESGEQLFTAKKISSSQGIPLKFLEKILQGLVNNGLLHVQYGPKGGYRLAKDASEITFLDVIKAVEGPIKINKCLDANNPSCCVPKCTMKDLWVKFQEEFEKLFDNITIAEATGSPKKKYRYSEE